MSTSPKAAKAPSTAGTATYLGPLLTDLSSIRRTAARKRKPFFERAGTSEQVAQWITEGWQVDPKRNTKVRKERDIDERLENRFWILLAKLGYPELSD